MTDWNVLFSNSTAMLMRSKKAAMIEAQRMMAMTQRIRGCVPPAAPSPRASAEDVIARILSFQPGHFRFPPSKVASITARQVEHMLGNIGQDQIGRDRRNLVKPGLAEFTLDVVLLGETEAAMRLQARF